MRFARAASIRRSSTPRQHYRQKSTQKGNDLNVRCPFRITRTAPRRKREKSGESQTQQRAKQHSISRETGELCVLWTQQIKRAKSCHDKGGRDSKHNRHNPVGKYEPMMHRVLGNARTGFTDDR